LEQDHIDDYGKTMLAAKSCAPEGGASGSSRPHARPVAHVQPPASGPRYALLDCTAAEISIHRSCSAGLIASHSRSSSDAPIKAFRLLANRSANRADWDDELLHLRW
jgi:hypothetical protein